MGGSDGCFGVARRLRKMFACTRINRIVIPIHRFLGLAFIVQWIVAVICWALLPVQYYLHKTPIWFTMPVGAIAQGFSAAYYFRYTTPKKDDPGFMSMGDVGRLSWFFVCENIFFAMLLAFQNVYYHPSFPIAGRGVSNDGSGLDALALGSAGLIEAAFVFLPYYWRPLFPKTALRDSHKHRAKNTNPANLDFYAKNTYVIKAFYNFAKHYIGFFLNYVRFMDRVKMYSSEHTTVYGIEILSSYMATFSAFIHTLVFKSVLTNKQGAMLYQAGYPFTFYFYWSVSSTLIWNNLDLTLLAGVGLVLNFVSMRAFHTYQAALMVTFFLWRDCIQPQLGLGSSASQSNQTASTTIGSETTTNDLLDVQNQQAFAECLQARFSLWSALGLCFAVVVVAPELPKLARRYNPFYPLAERLKKEKPHPEDDPIKTE